MPKEKFPKTVGAAIDLLYNMRSERLEEEKRIENMKKSESALREHIMANFAKQEVEGARGKLATASIKRSVQADITDWPAYLKYVTKSGNYSLVQKRAGITGLRELWDDGKQVPGVEPVVTEDLSLTKI